MISPATIDEIKNRMDIVEVVGDFVSLKRSGSSFKALSPFATEKTPSFFVVPSKGIFKCFSSGKGGDAIRFIMEIDGLSYVEALKYLAKKYGVEIQEEEQTDQEQDYQNKRESLYIILNYASDYFQQLLHNHEEGQSIGLSYFKERGFSKDTIEAFKLGYSLNVWDHFYQEATGKGYDPLLLEEAGLIIKKEEKIYDRFRGRVIFPIQNVTGKVIAFGARILTSDKKQPKYINSPETELYSKSQVLYGIAQAKQSIRVEDNCFLVEGYTDVISMHQADVKNVVSSSGTALTEQQVKLLKRYSENVTVLFDGDAAGIRASIRGIDLLLEGGLNVRAVSLPDGEDPDSLSRQMGTSAFKHYLIENAKDFIQFKTSILLAGVQNDPVKKAGVIREIVESIAKITDPIKRSVYIKQCSSLLDIDESVLIMEQNKLLMTKKRQNETQIEVSVDEILRIPEEPILNQPTKGDIITLQEKESIRLLLNYGHQQITAEEHTEFRLIEYFLKESAGELTFKHPVYRRIFDLIISRVTSGESFDMEFFLSKGDEEVQQTVIELVAPKYEISDAWKTKYQIHVPREADFIKDVAFSNIMRFKFRLIQQLIHLEQEKLKAVESSEIDQIIDDIKELKSIEVEIARVLGNVTAK